MTHPALALVTALALAGCQSAQALQQAELLRYGGMHETIGLKQHHGRVALSEVLDRPSFFGVGALEGLEGEITILDSAAVVTSVGPDGGLEPRTPAGLQATLLVGRSISEWTTTTLEAAVSPDRLDAAIAAAGGVGLDPAAPFMFVVEGALTDVRLHVINGACPVHARMKKLTLGEDERPFELEAAALTGTVVGVYAARSAGELTHPATGVHAHLIWADEATGQRVTGHLERFGLAPGAVVRLPTGARPQNAGGSYHQTPAP